MAEQDFRKGKQKDQGALLALWSFLLLKIGEMEVSQRFYIICFYLYTTLILDFTLAEYHYFCRTEKPY